MNVLVEKIGERDGKERFVLTNQETGGVITKNDVSEKTMRKYLAGIGETDKLIDECFRKARKRYEKSHATEPQGSADELDDIFSEIGLDDDDLDVD